MKNRLYVVLFEIVSMKRFSLIILPLLFLCLSCEDNKSDSKPAQTTLGNSNDKADTLVISEKNTESKELSMDEPVLDSQNTREKTNLIKWLKKTSELLRSDKFARQIKQGVEAGNKGQEYFDQINKQLLVEAGFPSYEKAFALIKKYYNDPEVKMFIQVLKESTDELMNKYYKKNKTVKE